MRKATFLSKVATNVQDIATLGTGALAQRFVSRDVSLRIEGIGKVRIRPRDSDYVIFRQVFVERQYEVPYPSAQTRIRAAYEAMLANGVTPLIVDCGANVGAASLWFAREFPRARVIAVEPDSANASLARRNCARFPTIEVVEAAVGAEPGYAQLEQPTWGGSAGVTTERHDSGVPIVTLNELVGRATDAAVLVVKIDIEGFEADLFTTNCEWLDGTVAVFLEPHDWVMPGKGTSSSFQSELGRRDFEIFVDGENLIYVAPDQTVTRLYPAER